MTAPRIITTEKTRPLRPLLAGLLSLAVPGLGQVYTGDLAAGLALALLRTLAPCIAVYAALARPERSSLVITVAMALLWLAITIATPVAAAVTAGRRGSAPVRAYTALPVYLLMAAAGIAATLASLSLAAGIFSAAAVVKEGALPLAAWGDIVLVSRWTPREYSRGDLVRCRDGRILRVMGVPGDRVRYAGSLFMVNDAALDLGHLTDETLAPAPGTPAEDLVFERSGGRQYAVLINRSLPPTAAFLVPTGARALTPDDRHTTRPVAVVADSDIDGRVEGILWSWRPAALLRGPWLPPAPTL